MIKKISVTYVPQLVLLACSPMASLTDDGEDDDKDMDDECIRFTAEVHAQFIRDTFAWYKVDPVKWIICQIADNAAVNQKIAKLLSIPHIPCKNHLLNSEVNYMTSKSNELSDVLESVQKTMRQCKKSLRNAAVLRNLTTLKPILHNKTRWSGKYDTLSRFIKIRSSLIDATNDENTNIDINTINCFLTKVKKRQKHMKRIQVPTKAM